MAFQIFELNDPVEDTFRFVYEKELIESMLRTYPSNSTMCPVAGTSHTVRLRDLKPAQRLLREKERRERAPAVGSDHDSEIL